MYHELTKSSYHTVYHPVQSYTLVSSVHCFKPTGVIATGAVFNSLLKCNFILGLLFLHTKEFYFTAAKREIKCENVFHLHWSSLLTI